jgi:hypothetical protein
MARAVYRMSTGGIPGPWRPGHDELTVGAGDLDPIAQDAIGFPG